MSDEQSTLDPPDIDLDDDGDDDGDGGDDGVQVSVTICGDGRPYVSASVIVETDDEERVAAAILSAAQGAMSMQSMGAFMALYQAMAHRVAEMTGGRG